MIPARTLGRRLHRVTLLCPRKVQQRRWAEVHDVRFLATTQAPRNIVEKYREKLELKAQSEGLRDIGELKAAYADRIQDLKKRDSISVPGLDALLADEEPKNQEPDTQAHNQSQPPQQQQQPQSPPQTLKQRPRPIPHRRSAPGAVKRLDEILDLPVARGLSKNDLTEHWRQRHASTPNSLCAVIPTATYRGIARTAAVHPTFVLPVPRPGQGAEIHFLQWVVDAATRSATVLFTQLAEYKARGEFAQPHTTVTHYSDYGGAAGSFPGGFSHEANQGLVLMAGSVVEGRGATLQDAQWLVVLLQRFYAPEGRGGDPAKRRLLDEFTRGGEGFSVEKLLAETEKLG